MGSVLCCKHPEGRSCDSIYFLHTLLMYTQDPGQSFAFCLGVTWRMLSHSHRSEALGSFPLLCSRPEHIFTLNFICFNNLLLPKSFHWSLFICWLFYPTVKILNTHKNGSYRQNNVLQISRMYSSCVTDFKPLKKQHFMYQ